MLDLINGEGRTSSCSSDPLIIKGIPMPKPDAAFEGESSKVKYKAQGSADWIILVQDVFLEEYALATEMVDVKGLEPRTVADAKRRPDWPL